MSQVKSSIINLKNTAMFLGISTATVRNWVKCGRLKTFDKETKYLFRKKDIEEMKSKIASGHLKKLNQRANKSKSDKTFMPEEYAQDKEGFNQLWVVLSFVEKNNMDIPLTLLLIALNLLKKEGVLSKVSIRDVAQKKDLSISNQQIKKEITSWTSQINANKLKDCFSFLLECDLPKQRDVLGFLYQSFLLEGQKSQSGSYYTPIR